MPDTEGLICLHPFYFMEFTTKGDAYTCCPSWGKSSIGNFKESTISEIWNSKRAVSIREKMYEGKWQGICKPTCPLLSNYHHTKQLIHFHNLEHYDYLSPELIAEIRQGKVRLDSTPTLFNMSHSMICNLSCIMCVRDSQVDDPALIRKITDDVIAHLPRARRIVMSGMGDPFARPDTREILTNYHPESPEFKIELITNGLLLPKYWDKVRHHNFDTLLVSVDAATRESYESIRKGGKWQDLLSTLRFIHTVKERFSSVTINMTVMRQNYKELPAFLDMAESLGFRASFQRIRGAWGRQNFFELHDIQAIQELSRIIYQEDARQRTTAIFWGDLYEFLDKLSPVYYPNMQLAETSQSGRILSHVRNIYKKCIGQSLQMLRRAKSSLN